MIVYVKHAKTNVHAMYWLIYNLQQQQKVDLQMNVSDYYLRRSGKQRSHKANVEAAETCVKLA